VGCRQCDKNSARGNTAVGMWDSISLRIEIIDQALTSKEGSFAKILEVSWPVTRNPQVHRVAVTSR
jgi:hypothetical protein